jgi:uncharacterized protein YjbI with pentapeptide repeats
MSRVVINEEVNRMANKEQLDLLKQGVEVWNQWRQENPDIRPDLEEADLRGAVLSGANLSNAYLSQANLGGTHLNEADLSRAQLAMAYLSGANLKNVDLSRAGLALAYLVGANLSGANLSYANLTEANLSGADFSRTNLFNARLKFANLHGTNLSSANLKEANLNGATFIRTNFSKATLINCSVHGIAVWSVQLEDTIQSNLTITSDDEPAITVDNLKIAQFIYLLLYNQEIRDIIETVTSKVVLILGRFTPERKAVLDAIREELRKHNYAPVLFDFEKPTRQSMAETIRTLAHLARFIIVDLTDPRSVPAELATIVPHCLVPVQPLLETTVVVVEENVTGKHVVERNMVKGKEYALFRSLQLYPWVLPVFHYQDTVELFNSLKEHVIDPAEQKAQELARQK